MSKTYVPPPPPAAAATQNDVSALLLEVLRNVNREAQASTALGSKAQAAVQHFHDISVSLRTLADGNATAFSSSAGAQRASAG